MNHAQTGCPLSRTERATTELSRDERRFAGHGDPERPFEDDEPSPLTHLEYQRLLRLLDLDRGWTEGDLLERLRDPSRWNGTDPVTL